jgi:hypothetical protein
MTPRRTPVFCGVPERQVDQVLDHLCDWDLLPQRCLVLGSDMGLLGALTRHWAPRVDVIVAFVPSLDNQLLDVAQAIAHREGLSTTALAWVCGPALSAPLPDLPGPALLTDAGDAVALAKALAQQLSKSL